MKYINAGLLLLAAITGIFCSCQKELSCEGPECRGIYDDGKAIYSFIQNNGACGGAVVSGIYKQGIDLDDSNTVSLKVNVAKKGVYIIGTDTVNGFYFRNQGTFADTGMVSVVLKGMGKAGSSGFFNFINNQTSGCNFRIRVETVPFVEHYFYDVTIDGLRYTQTVGGVVKNMNSFTPSSPIPIVGRIGKGNLINYTDGGGGPEGFGIQKSFISLFNVNFSGLTNFFQVGSHSFSPPNSADGTLVYWINGGEDFVWASYLLPGTQTGSNFIIDSVETYTDTQGRPIAKVKARFNCMLYNGHGASKVLTNGKYYGEFANINR